LLAAVSAALRDQGHDVLSTREPGGTPLAESVRQLVLTPPQGNAWSPMAEALLMNAARRDHLEKRIRPALEIGTLVICDRFADSTRVYQGYCGGVSLDVLRQMEAAVLGETRPHLTLILDLPVDLAAARRTARGGARDAFEARDAAFHQRVRDGFRAIAEAEPERCRLIDAAQPPADLAAEALALIAAAMR
jgi:dTMP kinase